MRLFRLFTLLFLLANTSATLAKKHKLTILHTNDHHGRFWKNSNGEYGLAARTTLIQSIRKEVKKEGGKVLLLSGGDINTGVPESDLLEAEPDFKGMGILKYDAMAVGNHEFDNPLQVILKQQNWSKIPFLAANIFYEGKKKGPFQPYIIKRLKGLKVGIVGFTTTDTPLKTDKKNTRGLVFKDPTQVAPSIINKLKKRNVDFIIAVTHMGHYKDANHGNEAPGDVTLARSVKGFDVIVGGHSQIPLFKPDIQNGTYIVQAYEWGKYLGRMDIEIDDKTKKWTMLNYKLIPINLKKKVVDDSGEKKYVLVGEEIAEDKMMLDFLTPFYESAKKKFDVKIGETLHKLEGDRDFVRSRQTNLGVIMASVLRAATKSDIGVYNSGGIRDSIAKGIVTFRDVLKVEPFGNTICTVEMTGKELKEYLESIYANQPGSGAFPQVVGADGVLKDGKITKMYVLGAELDENRVYKLALTSFLTTGGDGYPEVDKKSSFVNSQIPISFALRKYFEENSPVDLSQSAVTSPFRDELN